jgi:hypothetical protein
VLSFLPTRFRLSLAVAFPFAFAPPSSPRFPLDRDTLGSVLSFLTLRELTTALLVSKEWATVLQSMHPAMLHADISSGTLDALLASRLRRHAGQLDQRDKG